MTVSTPCVEWPGRRNAKGYGIRWANGQTTTAHRSIYLEQVGPIPAGWTVDHLCRNRACVNIAHLEAVPHRENCLRGEPANRTHCPAGHPYDEANTYLSRRGSRVCRRCRNISRRRYPQYR